MKKPFTTIEQVEKYLTENENTLRCLICGKRFKNGGPHMKTHDITVREYKIRFGIPQTRRLTPINSQKKVRPAPAHLHRAHEAARISRENKRRKKPIFSSASLDSLAKSASDPEKIKKLHQGRDRMRSEIIEVICPSCGNQFSTSEFARKSVETRGQRLFCSERCKRKRK